MALSHVSVDIDGYAPQWRYKAIRAYHHLDRMADRVEVHLSSGGKGLHIIGYFENELIDLPTEISMRRELNDDPNRIEMDVKRAMAGLARQVCWNSKSSNADAAYTGGEKVRGFEDVWAALDAIDAQRDDLRAVKRLQLHGHRGAPDLAPKAEGWA